MPRDKRHVLVPVHYWQRLQEAARDFRRRDKQSDDHVSDDLINTGRSMSDLVHGARASKPVIVERKKVIRDAY